MARKLRSKNGPRDSRNRAPPSKEANLIQIDVPPRRRQIRILLGLFQQLVEFLFEHLAVRFLRFELLAKTSSRRPASPFSLATAAARSSIAGGFSGTAWAITARVSGSIFRTALQQGHSTSNRPSDIVPIVAPMASVLTSPARAIVRI